MHEVRHTLAVQTFSSAMLDGYSTQLSGMNGSPSPFARVLYALACCRSKRHLPMGDSTVLPPTGQQLRQGRCCCQLAHLLPAREARHDHCSVHRRPPRHLAFITAARVMASCSWRRAAAAAVTPPATHSRSALWAFPALRENVLRRCASGLQHGPSTGAPGV
jgi:hypothetical protein